MFFAMSRRKAVQFSRAGFNAGDGGDDGGGGSKVAEGSAVKKPSLKEGRVDTQHSFSPIYLQLRLLMSWQKTLCIDFSLSVPNNFGGLLHSDAWTEDLWLCCIKNSGLFSLKHTEI